MEELKKKRAQMKSQLTRFKTYINSCDESNSDVFDISTRLEKIELLWDTFSNCQSQIELGDNSEAQVGEREAFEESFFKTVSDAKRLISRLNSSSSSRQDSSPTPSNATPPSGEYQLVNNLNTNLRVKLPTIQLMEFTGDYKKFAEFNDTFEALINSNRDLTNIQRFYYLKSCLRGEAAQVIQNIKVSDTNYDIAWNLLKERFDNKRVIINSHLKSIFELPFTYKESAPSLRSLLDSVQKDIRCLKALGEPTDQWSSMLIYIVSAKLDAASKREWEMSIKGSDIPTYEQFIEFLKNRCILLENLSSKNINSNSNVKFHNKSLANFSNQGRNCPFCNRDHLIYFCEKFKALSAKSRFFESKKLGLCLNCLKYNHITKECRSTPCKYCNKFHNSLLHFGNENTNNNFNANTNPKDDSIGNFSGNCNDDSIGNFSGNNNCNDSKDNSGVNCNRNSKIVSGNHNLNTNRNSRMGSNNNISDNEASNFVVENSNCAFSKSNSVIFLATAICFIFDSDGKPIKCRCLLDNGSQSINQNQTNISLKTTAKIQSIYNQYNTNLDFLVLNNITGNIPAQTVNNLTFEIPKNIKLADPTFNKSQPIDILLGAAVFWELLCDGQICLGPKQLILKNTLLGYIVSGPMIVNNKGQNKNKTCLLAINDQLERFWRVEEMPDKILYTKQESFCENNFINTHKQNSNGRFIVQLPFIKNPCCLGESLHQATKRFYALESKFKNNTKFKETYQNFILEYKNLEHMSEIPELEINKPSYYLPHHGVFKNDSTTTKLRVVFDASCKTSTNISLNEILAVGPKIQDDIFSILIRFRKHNFVFIADIEKMYRQVLVDPRQRDYQRIVWRDSPSEKLKHFRLNTVTYGTASASFLAIRSLHQAAINNKELYPEAYRTILSDFYVDDLITGSNCLEDAKNLKSQLTNILNKSGFHLRKFMSNDKDLISDCDKSNEQFYTISDDLNVKTLGIFWESNNDWLKFSVKSYNNAKITKRLILSRISQIFDPLGLVGPIIIRAKLLLQELWKAGSSWDDEVPVSIKNTYIDFQNDCLTLNQFKIPRQAFCPNIKSVQLHGFSDSSEQAFGACIYVRSTDNSDKTYVNLLCAKSKVAPLKTISLPRLELCGFLLLVRLMNQVTSSLNLNIDEIYYWTDSTIVLSWIAAEPSSWKTFVAHRVSEIQTLAKNNNFYHVASADNPADIISRGSNVLDLFNHSLWFNGPDWLKNDIKHWPMSNLSNSPNFDTELLEKRSTTALISIEPPTSFDLLNKYSNFLKLQRVTALCLRFINNLKNPANKILGKISIDELDNALTKLILLAQKQAFFNEINSLNNNCTIKRNSCILSLNPFLDKCGVLRVGGRLRNANIPYNQKHQALLPQSSSLTKLIITYEHERLLHAGTQFVLSSIRNNYWIINGRTVVRGILKKCVKCFRAKPIFSTQIMGNLPEKRVTPTRPFLTCGIDYAGPFNIKDGITRSRKIIKTYICLFVCFSTKAVHLELAGDLSTETFLNCLKRFIARRGYCQNIFSDNATNFVGAANTLKGLENVISDPLVLDYLRNNRVNWQFIPPRSPHFGGLHERAVSSCKHHLVRIMADKNLNYESFNTILAQVEAILNSRPLSPLSSDPNDLNPLTPAHFLIGSELTTLPEPNVTEIPITRLNKYQLIQQCTQHFWKRWHKEYLNNLQQRSKWKFSKDENIKVGTMVLVKEENLPPMNWRLGRIIETFPGDDDVIRVIKVKTKHGIFKRSTKGVAILPFDDGLSS